MTTNQIYFCGLYVSQLPENIKSIVQREVFNSLKNSNNLSESEVEESLELAMNGKLQDLEDLIDLNLVLKRVK